LYSYTPIAWLPQQSIYQFERANQGVKQLVAALRATSSNFKQEADGGK
jgi:hypothetical protein